MGEPIGGNSVIWNVSRVPPRPSPATPASAVCTSVKDGGRVVTSWPIIGTTVVAVAVAVPPRPSSNVTSSSRLVRLVTVYRTSSSPDRPTTSPGATVVPSSV
ncbi:hypothetical protein [Cellulomonas persica]